MKSNKHDKRSAVKKASTGTSTEDDSGAGASHATTPTTVGSSTNRDPPTVPAPTTVGSPTNHDPPTAPALLYSSSASSDSLPLGISMVNRSLIVFDPDVQLDTIPESVPSRVPSRVASRAVSIAALKHSEQHKDGVRNVEATNNHLANMDDHRRVSYSENIENESEEAITTSSMYSLEKEVRQYIIRRESDVYSYYPGTERSIFDYISERTDMYTTNLIESTAYLIKGSLGAAVLSMHEAYKIGGLWTSLCVTIIVGVLLGYTMIMLIRSAQKMYRRLRITKLSYPDLAEAALATAPWSWINKRSKTFRRMVEVSLLMQMFGTCCIYQIIIANIMRQFIASLNSETFTPLFDVRLYILISAPLLIPLCLIKSLKFMAPFALIADVFVAICVFTTLYYSLLTSELHRITERTAWRSTHTFSQVFGICMYSTSGVCFALPVENNMKRPRYFPLVVRYATTIVIVLSVMTGFFGYWAWGESCTSPITVHMPTNTFTTILQFFLVLMLSITFAVNFWVPFRVVWHYIVRRHRRKLALWEMFYRFIMAMLVMGASMIIPNTIPVMVFLGHFFLGFIALVFPAIIEVMVDWEEEFTKPINSKLGRNTKNFGLVVLGLMLSGSTFFAI